MNCVADNGSIGVLGIAFAIAAYNIAKLYFKHKDNKNERN